LQGKRAFIDDFTTHGPSNDDSNEEGYKEFRDKLQFHLGVLTGTVPKFKKNTDGKWCVRPD